LDSAVDIEFEQKKDHAISQIQRILTSTNPSDRDHPLRRKFGFDKKNRVIYQHPDGQPRLVVPNQLRERVMSEYHDRFGHLGRDRTYHLLSERYFWTGMNRDVRRWVQSCLTCAKFKPAQPTHHGLLTHLQAHYPFEIVGIDLMGPFKTTKTGYRYVMVIVDLFTNWVEAVPLRGISAEEAALAFFDTIVTRHGCPTNVLSDLGTNFNSELFRHLCRRCAIKNIYTSSKHPQTNGEAERFIRFLTNALAMVAKMDQSDWDLHLPSSLFAYRISEKLMETPFYLLYGRDAILPSDLLFEPHRQDDVVESDTSLTKLNYKIDLLSKLRYAYEKLERKRDRYQNDYRKNYDKTHRHIEFSVGELVMMFWPVPKKGYALKLLPKWDGPYQVLSRVGMYTYRISKGQKTFCVHVQRLTKFVPWESGALSPKTES